MKHTENLICNTYMSGLRHYILQKVSKSHITVWILSTNWKTELVYSSHLCEFENFWSVCIPNAILSFLCKSVYSICGGLVALFVSYFLFRIGFCTLIKAVQEIFQMQKAGQTKDFKYIYFIAYR